MLILSTYDEFKKMFRVGKKWIRCQEAIENIKNIKENEYHSVGDSLVYMVQTNFEKEKQFLEGHRRYMDVHYYIEGTEELEITIKKGLKIKRKYCDEDDTEYFYGNGKVVSMKTGNFVIIENNEAFKFKNAKNLKKVVLKVTVEDNYFLNK